MHTTGPLSAAVYLRSGSFPFSSGKFGACFQPALCKQSDLLVYASRPGLRLWRTDVRGHVQETHVLKPLFNQDVPQFELFPRPTLPANGAYRPTDRQLGVVGCFLKEGWVLSWNEYSVYIVDSTNQVRWNEMYEMIGYPGVLAFRCVNEKVDVRIL